MFLQYIDQNVFEAESSILSRLQFHRGKYLAKNATPTFARDMRSNEFPAVTACPVEELSPFAATHLSTKSAFCH